MGRGKALTKDEKAQICVLRVQRYTYRLISYTIGRSVTAIGNYLRKLRFGAKVKKGGRKPKLIPRMKRAIIKEARKGLLSASQLAAKYEVPVSVRRIQQVLQEDDTVLYRNLNKQPAMTKKHKGKRVKWAAAMAGKDARYWDSVVFSDEKRFRLDEPDGNVSEWGDARLPPRLRKRRQAGGGSIMVWGAICSHGASKLVLVSDKVDSVMYTEVLEDALLPFIEQEYEKRGQSAVFQHDGAHRHTAIHAKEFLMDAGIVTMPWPAMLPDMNVIGNVWAWMVRDVYQGNRQFDCVEDLTDAVMAAWDRLDNQKLKSL